MARAAPWASLNVIKPCAHPLIPWRGNQPRDGSPLQGLGVRWMCLTNSIVASLWENLLCHGTEANPQFENCESILNLILSLDYDDFKSN